MLPRTHWQRRIARPFTKPVRQKLLLKEVDEAVVTAHHMQVDRESFLAPLVCRRRAVARR